MSNGIAKITIHEGDQKGEYTLRFGMLGCAEFERRVLMNPTPNNTKLLIDMIYGGLYGEAMRNEQAVPKYSLSEDILESLEGQEDYHQQTMDIQKTYEESKFGKQSIEKFNNLKKKLEDLESMIQ